MSDNVFVVREAPTGRWIAACCDTRCGFGMHTLADTEHKTTADAAATRHRKYLRTLPVYDETRRTDICQHCGQSEKTNRALRDLVAELEARLARYETNEDAA